MNKQQAQIAEVNKWDIEAVQAYIDLGKNIGDEQLKNFEESYAGKWDSNRDFVYNLMYDTATIPEDLPPYVHIDWEATARDVMMDYSQEKVYYFRDL